MSDYGLKWTDGTDISEAELKNLIISSSHPCLKFSDIGTGSITYTHDSTQTDQLVATHNLGYEPLFRFLTQWFDIDTDSKVETYRNAPFIDSQSNGAVYFIARPYVNNTQLKYYVRSFTGSGTESITLKFLYIIYYDPDQDI